MKINKRNILPVIMAGGSGTRLWPLSRNSTPKQFLSLFGGETLLEETLLRIHALDITNPLIITNEKHRFLVAEQSRNVSANSQLILEPCAKNTAPAIALAALDCLKKGFDPVLLVLAADHHIGDENSFFAAIEKAYIDSENGSLVTFGIVPTTAETGYGYIKKGLKQLSGAFSVDKFVEKPDIETAKKYLLSGEYLWNSGMFMFKASAYLNELEKFSPEIYLHCKNAVDFETHDLNFTRVDSVEFDKCPSDSIDYAVMEKTDLSVVVPLDAGWSDIGSWSAIWDLSTKDKNGNAIRGDVTIHNSHNNYIHSSGKLVSLVGINDAVIVDTQDALLVAKKDQVQNVKHIVNSLSLNNRKEIDTHSKVFRPWGSHDLIADGERYAVKKVTVHPGKQTASQIHYNRAEHWIVVSGTALITKDGVKSILNENESTYIPPGMEHAFCNPGKIPLVIVEVRTGTYLSEDDVSRNGEDKNYE